ncbi:MAG: 4a-hydroxytetrahydrobiopterin dehydratase [Vampirovibrionales bacterium]|nr:4a-hydroxytetrahydrobiopterin dehydratase [Vampirovibrionales bacterium]
MTAPAELPELIGWQPGVYQNASALQATVRFTTFRALMRFINLLADEAERVRHHPALTLDYTTLEIIWTTHDAGGLTERDYAMARWCNQTLDAFRATGELNV